MSGGKRLGHVLMWAGFVASAFVASSRTDNVDWLTYSLTAGVGVVGVVLLRMRDRANADSDRKAHETVGHLTKVLQQLLDKLAQLRAERETVDVYDVRHRIDSDLAGDLRDFADEREAISEAHSLKLYADVMNHFAAGERNINRAWSASADGYIDEVWICLERAESLMGEGLGLLREQTKRE